MSKQQEFVLRTIEERNIRFIRLWFTDVLGYLKSVAIAPAELVNAFEEALVRRVIAMVDKAEYKRRQYPPGPKVSKRAFGKDRRLPMTSRWSE